MNDFMIIIDECPYSRIVEIKKYRRNMLSYNFNVKLGRFEPQGKFNLSRTKLVNFI